MDGRVKKGRASADRSRRRDRRSDAVSAVAFRHGTHRHRALRPLAGSRGTGTSERAHRASSGAYLEITCHGNKKAARRKPYRLRPYRGTVAGFYRRHSSGGLLAWLLTDAFKHRKGYA